VALERTCPRCGSYIIIDGKHIRIRNTLRAPYSNVTCYECKQWIVDNYTG